MAFMGDVWSAGMSLIQYILGSALWKPHDDDELKHRLCKVPKTHKISDHELISNLEHGVEFEGGIDVRAVLGQTAKDIPKDILESLYAMLTFDPRQRARNLGISRTDIRFSNGLFLNSEDPVECMISKKLYNCDDDAFIRTRRKLSISTDKLCDLEEQTIRRFLKD